MNNYLLKSIAYFYRIDFTCPISTLVYITQNKWIIIFKVQSLISVTQILFLPFLHLYIFQIKMNDCFDNSVTYLCHWNFISSILTLAGITKIKWMIISKTSSLISITLILFLSVWYFSVLHKTNEWFLRKFSQLFLSHGLIYRVYKLVFCKKSQMNNCHKSVPILLWILFNV